MPRREAQKKKKKKNSLSPLAYEVCGLCNLTIAFSEALKNVIVLPVPLTKQSLYCPSGLVPSFLQLWFKWYQLREPFALQ